MRKVYMKILRTVLGDVSVEQLGLILPHEHLFTDLGGPERPGYAQADQQEVVQVLAPFLEAASQAGITALVECSTGGVGRNIEILLMIAKTTPIHIVAPTGVYREAFIPAALRSVPQDDLAAAWIKDLTAGIEGTTARAGFIKMAVSDDGPTVLEVRTLKAAAAASNATGAAVASHTIRVLSAFKEMDILEEEGMDLRRFIWVHANAEAGTPEHLEAVRRGAYVEFDSIGAPYSDQEALLDYTIALIDAGFTSHILLSHDAGWYQPGQPDGQPEGGIRGYTALVDTFLPALSARGISEEVIHHLTWTNPVQAFALEVD
jgi:phosphotriesterase-related protein